VEFRTDVFDAASIQALTERLQRVLTAMTADPARVLSSVDVLDEVERARLDGWGNRAVLTAPGSAPVSIPVLLAAQVARTPDAVALVCGPCSWTYRGLDEAANRLAHLLAGHGAGPGQCVALLFSRSAEAIVAILAVLKTGAAYLPLDPGLPADRIGFMLTDAAPAAAITTAELADRLKEFDVMVIDVEDPSVDTQPGTALPSPTATWSISRSPCPPVCRRLRCGRSATPMRSTSRCGRSGLPCWVGGGWWWCLKQWPARRRTSTISWSMNGSAC
jgi:non-ribosomal peptide synthetase component F